MAKNEIQGDLFPGLGPSEGTRVINDRCLVKTLDERRLVVVSGIVLAQYMIEDRMSEANAMVCLVDQGWAAQNDVARAFGFSVRTVRRFLRRYEDGGLAALRHSSGYPKGRRRLKRSRTKLIHRLKAEGCSNREIARRVGVN